MLKSIKYVEYENQTREWTLDQVDFKSKNLIVGRNSTGKSRTLNVVASLGRALTANAMISQFSSYEVVWEFAGKKYQYRSSTKDNVVDAESLEIDGSLYLQRTQNGEGHVLYEKIDGGLQVQFHCLPNEYALAKRRDSFQHASLEPLFQWADLLRHYKFGGSLGKDSLNIASPTAMPVDEKDENAAVPLFRDGKRDFGAAFVKAVIADIRHVGFNVFDINIGSPTTITVHGFPGEPIALIVHEDGVSVGIDQFSMSSGMYRVVALMIHLNYLDMKGRSACVVIDDIGEGLDYERSCALIDLLRRKAETTSLQVIMSTNDNFVMDKVPLQEWTVLKRVGNHVSVRNYENSAEVFDDFRFTGLSNFSFFEMDFIDSDSDGEQ